MSSKTFKILLIVMIYLQNSPVILTDVSPSIVTVAQNVTVVRGEEVVLGCSVHNLGSHQQIVWRRGFEVLAAGPIRLKLDTRYSVVSGIGSSQLTIQSVRMEDGGEFVCQVQTQDDGLKEVKHSLVVQVPPTIQPIPVEGSLTARQGESVSLRCNATGVPIPTIAWHKSVGTAPGGHPSCGGSCYTIPYVDLAASGDYICSAVNGVGHPQHATLTLNVLYPPVVSCAFDQVQGGGGVAVVLGCLVHGEPAPSVDWFRDGQLLDISSRRYRMEWNLDKRVHSLVIKKCEAYDFGNYSCVASNLMGTSRSFTEVHGRPSNLSFLPTPHLSSPHYHQLKWTTTSHYVVDVFTILYRKVSAPSEVPDSQDWTVVKIPATEHHQTIMVKVRDKQNDPNILLRKTTGF